MTFRLTGVETETPGREHSGGDFDLLRSLVVGQEQVSIRKLEKRLENLEHLLREQHQRMVQVLLDQKDDFLLNAGPAALDWLRQLEHREDAPWEEVGAALAAPVEEGVKHRMAQHPEALGRLFSSVFLQSAKTSVAELGTRIIQRFDSLLHRLMPVRALWWRLVASSRGIPYEDLVFQKTCRFVVETAQLLDYSGSMVLMAAVNPEALHHARPIRAKADFSKKSLQITGDYFSLRLRANGSVGPEVQQHAAAVLRMIEEQFGQEPDMRDLRPAESAELQRLLREVLVESAPPRKFCWFAGLAAAAVVTALGVWGGAMLKQGMRERQLVAALRQQPGIVVSSTEHLGGKLVIYGLRDPLAADPASFLPASRLTTDSVRFELAPYHSIGTAFEMQRQAEQRTPDSAGAPRLTVQPPQ